MENKQSRYVDNNKLANEGENPSQRAEIMTHKEKDATKIDSQ